MSDVVRYSREGDIGFITVANPPVNALSQAVRQGLLDALAQGLGDDAAKAIVLHCEGRTFIAGADIREFGKPPQPPSLGDDVIRTLEASPKPLIAAIHGTALGGGLEVAMGCHWRAATPKAKVGLPEVKLGILPGAGGTQRLPRLAGVEAAIEMITTGDFVPAARARELGIVDAVAADEDARAAGAAFARAVIDENRGVRPTGGLNDKVTGVDPAVFDAARKKLEKTARGRFAPFNCLKCVEAATALPLDEGLKRERELFMECMNHPQRKAMIHAFFGERAVAKVPGLGDDVRPREVAKGAVLGAGTMGGGIAMCFANAGIPVTVIEQSQDALDRGLKRIGDLWAGSAKRGRITAEEAEKRVGLVTGALSLDAAADADLVIEAVFERMDVKKDVFTRLDAIAKPGAVLATNTSYLNVDEIAGFTRRPQDVLGMHFFSPANVMRLLEVVRGAKTADDALTTALKIGKLFGKVSVVSGVCDGFIGNRMLKNYRRQCDYMIEDGALPWDVDAAMTAFGFPMGPFQMNDLAGLDIGYFNRRREDETRDPAERYVDIADKLYDLNRLGQKTGKGWYDYSADPRRGAPDPEVEAIIRDASARRGVTRRAFGAEEIRMRALCALVNEGARILDEGIAARAVDIDMVWLFGYGFPAHEGGPMFWADAQGLPAVLAAIEGFAKDDPRSWTPAPLLARLAKAGEKFADHG